MPSSASPPRRLLVLMMLLTFVDVVARYLFNRPIRGGFEVTELHAAGADLRRPAAGVARRRARHHGLHRPHAAAAARAAAGCAPCTRICAAIMFFLTWQVWIKADEHRRLRRHHRRAAHHRRAVRLLHGGDDRAHRRWCTSSRCSCPAQRARQQATSLTAMTETLIGLLAHDGAGVPAPADRARHGHGRHRRLRLHARLELGRGLRHGADQGLRDRAQLHAVGGAAVHPDGQLRDARRHVAGAVPRRLRLHRPPARRPGDGHHRRLRRLRRDLRLVDRHRGDLRQGRLSVDEEVRLLRRARDRRDRRRRHARHPDPALHHHGDLRHHDRHQHRQAVRRRHPARHPRHAAAVRRGAVRHLARPEGRARAASACRGRSASPRSRAWAGSPRSASR